MRHLLMTSALGAVLYAAHNDQGGGSTASDTAPGDKPAGQPISAPSDGQIALTAHNNGDGTWSVKRGPDGPVLQDGLPREKALAIVGGATGPYEPANAQEQVASDARAALEAQEAQREEREVFQSDEEALAGVQTPEALAAENADLKAENERLKAQVAKFDKDGDGKTGGGSAKPKASAAQPDGVEGKGKNGGE